jgi:ATP synthase subunit 6
MHNLISGLQKENLQLTRQYFYLPIMYLFQLILISNLTGLAPFAFTLTSSFVVTFFLASAFFIFINVIGTYNLQYEMFNLFLPSGTPLWIIPFLVLIELLSYVARVFSLSIRLFANMMSGHALLKILIGFAFAMLGSSLAVLAILP